MRRIHFGLNWSGTVREAFVVFLEEACRRERLSFLWISDENLKEAVKKLETNQMRIRVLLDTEATYNKKGDFYARACYAVKDSGGAVINDPDRTKVAIDKSITQYELQNAGIETPYTVIVRNWEPNTYRLSESERTKLGIPFVIKPALGYGQLGLVRDARGSIREIAKARNYDRGDNFLLQEKIIPIELAAKRAWFRVFNIFNTIIPCWWDDHQNRYQHVDYEEFNSYGLYPLVKIVAKIAGLTRMAWFSTEVAIDKKNGKKRFVTIDYVNDQCDMSTQTETPSGVPDSVVKYTANHIVSVASRFIREGKVSKRYAILLKDARVELRGLGSAPDLLNPTASQKAAKPDSFGYRVLKFFTE